MRITKTHYYFWNTIYSQWYMSKNKDYLFEENGVKFITAEHYMMYHKALTFSDNEIASKILETLHPRDVKALGRLVKNYDDKLWSKVRFDIEGSPNNTGADTDKYQIRVYYHSSKGWQDAILNDGGYKSEADVLPLLQSVGPATINDLFKIK